MGGLAHEKQDANNWQDETQPYHSFIKKHKSNKNYQDGSTPDHFVLAHPHSYNQRSKQEE